MAIKRFVVLATILLASCASAQSLPAATSTATATSIPTVTPTPAPTATNTPIPTPFGGSGKLMVVVDHEIKVLNPGGSDEKIMVSQQEFEQKFPLPASYSYRFSSISPDGQKIIVATCRYAGFSICYDYKLYLSRIDGSRTSILGSNSGVPAWSPDGKKILIRAGKTGRQVFSAEEEFGGFVDLPSASAAFWSYDSKLIYYYDKGWYTVKNDGTDIQALKCDICKMATEPSAYAVAQSPDGQKIALGMIDGTVVITDPDLIHFKFANLGSYVNTVHWSPDSKKLAVDITSGSDKTDIVILGSDGAIIQQLQRPEGIQYVNTCNWSPDSQAIDYIALRDSGGDLYLQSLDAEKPLLLASFQIGEDSCPVWLTGNP
jgi:Tol biopolymer transport system component